MVRRYGKAPYKIVLVHGGPGAVGSLKGFAQELSELSQAGVIEALQSEYSIEGLIEELYHQIRDNCSGRVSLAGHSWGAWLAALFAEKHPECVGRLILIGSAPLEDKYVPEITRRRLQNLSDEDKGVFQRLVDHLATDEDMGRIPGILERSDNYCIEEQDRHQADKADSEMYHKIWKEAAQRRSSGALLKSFQNVKSKLYLIQGEFDPHPAEGVTLPLQEKGIPCETYVLRKCGHSPFMEKYAKEEFYKILLQVIR